MNKKEFDDLNDFGLVRRPEGMSPTPKNNEGSRRVFGLVDVAREEEQPVAYKDIRIPTPDEIQLQCLQRERELLLEEFKVLTCYGNTNTDKQKMEMLEQIQQYYVQINLLMRRIIP